MSEEFSQLPDINALLAQRIAARQSEASGTPAPGTFDPYEMMIKKKRGEPIEVVQPEVQTWPEEDIQKLQDYCKKVGIVGYNCGRMHPLAALAMLKKQFGDYSDVPLEERVPEGYEKIGTKSTNNPNYPYSQATTKKQILHG